MIDFFKSVVPEGMQAYFYNIFLALPIVLIGWWFINKIFSKDYTFSDGTEYFGC